MAIPLLGASAPLKPYFGFFLCTKEERNICVLYFVSVTFVLAYGCTAEK
jgi:hypothetical protein